MDTSRNGAGHMATIIADEGKSSSQACELENKHQKERWESAAERIVWVRAAEIVEDRELKGLVPLPGLTFARGHRQTALAMVRRSGPCSFLFLITLLGLLAMGCQDSSPEKRNQENTPRG